MITLLSSTKSGHFRSSLFTAVSFTAVSAARLTPIGRVDNDSRSNRSLVGALPTPYSSAAHWPTSPAFLRNADTRGTLAAYFAAVRDGAMLTYRDVTTVTSPSLIVGRQPTSKTVANEYTTGGGANPFATENIGKSEVVTLATAQGNVCVVRQENLDDDNRLIGYTYFTLDAQAYTLYGQDSLDARGRISSRTRYSPAARFAINLRPGESASQKVRVAEADTDLETGGAAVTRREFEQTFTMTFVGVRPTTVPAGTYNAALVNWGFTYGSTACDDQPAYQVEATVSVWLDPAAGLVKSTMDSRSRVEFRGSGEEQSQTVETRIQSDTELVAVE